VNTEVRVPRRDRVQSSSVTYAHWTAGGERTASCRRFVTGPPCLITVHRVLLFLAQHAALNGCECDPRIDPPIVRSLGLTVVLPPSQPDKADYTSFDWLINCRTTSAFCWRFERRSHVLSNLPSKIANAGFGWPWHSTFKFVRGSIRVVDDIAVTQSHWISFEYTPLSIAFVSSYLYHSIAR